MALFRYEDLKNKYTYKNESYDYLVETNNLRKSRYISLDSISKYDSFDIFLSHSYSDRDIIPDLKIELENFGFSVYVDWINDKLLSRDNITKETATVLQKRMKQSKCLIYVTSENSNNSRWMPWELGYFDGIKDKMVGILPLKKHSNNFKDDFIGEEYLGLYFYIDKADNTLYINKDSSTYIQFGEWLQGKRI